MRVNPHLCRYCGYTAGVQPFSGMVYNCIVEQVYRCLVVYSHLGCSKVQGSPFVFVHAPHISLGESCVGVHKLGCHLSR